MTAANLQGEFATVIKTLDLVAAARNNQSSEARQSRLENPYSPSSGARHLLT